MYKISVRRRDSDFIEKDDKFKFILIVFNVLWSSTILFYRILFWSLALETYDISPCIPQTSSEKRQMWVNSVFGQFSHLCRFVIYKAATFRSFRLPMDTKPYLAFSTTKLLAVVRILVAIFAIIFLGASIIIRALFVSTTGYSYIFCHLYTFCH